MENPKVAKNQTVYEATQEDWPWLWAIEECVDWKKGLTAEEIRETTLSQAQLPVPITDNLYLGDMQCIDSVEKLKAKGITAVLNMAGPIVHPSTIQAFKDNGIEYKQIDGDDEYDYPLLQNHWQEAFDFIQSTTQNGQGKCVVHCLAGMNRSGLIATAYFMMSTQTNVLESVQHVRRQRGNVALSNEGFQAQLVALSRKHDLLGPAPGTEGSIVKQQAPPSSKHFNCWE